MKFVPYISNIEIKPRSEIVFLMKKIEVIHFHQLFERCYLLSTQIYNRGFTYLEQVAMEIWRGDFTVVSSNNCFNELKILIRLEKFNIKGLFHTIVTLIFVIVAYNLLFIFRLFVLLIKAYKSLYNLPCNIFTTGAYFGKINHTFKLKTALPEKQITCLKIPWKYSFNSYISI